LLAGFLGELAREFKEFPIMFESWKHISNERKTKVYDKNIKVSLLKKLNIFYLLFVLLYKGVIAN
jgi:hypothetical protein